VRRFVALVLMGATVAAGCGNDAVKEGAIGTGQSTTSAEREVTTTTGSSKRALHPTYPADECCNQAGLVLGPRGSQLAGDPSTGCVWFQGVGNEARVAVVWPKGFTVSFSPLRVYGFDGSLLAEEGVTYTSLGGNEEANPPAECHQDEIVLVTTWRIGEVNERREP
jgi:hypothetical protein